MGKFIDKKVINYRDKKEDKNFIKFIDYIKKMNYLLGSSDPFAPLYNFGGFSNA